MEVRAALAAADAGEGGDGIPVAVAVAAKRHTLRRPRMRRRFPVTSHETNLLCHRYVY